MMSYKQELIRTIILKAEYEGDLKRCGKDDDAADLPLSTKTTNPYLK